MDTKKLFRLLFLVLGYCLTMTSCSDDSKTDWNLAPSLITRSVVTPDFDWENADWMPTPAGYALNTGSLDWSREFVFIL